MYSFSAGPIGYESLKSEQLQVMRSFVQGNDVFAVLPTGYGKSLCYARLPMVLGKLQAPA